MTEKWEIGNIDNSPIGQATPAAGAFTTLAASGNVTPATLTASKIVASDGSKNLVSIEPTVFETGGAQEIDGDKLDVDFTPTSYTPDTSPGEADNADNLAAHLKGIDNALGRWMGLSWNESTDVYTRRGSLAGQAVSASPGNAMLPIHAAMRRCVMSDAGVVQYYLDPDDSTKKADGSAASLDGTDGQVMVEIPKFYIKYSYTTNVHTWDISLQPLSGFVAHPAFYKDGAWVDYRYIGAYEGVGYDNSAAAYIDCGTGAADNWSGTTIDTANDKLGSVSGFAPMMDETRAEFRALASNRGAGWRQQDYFLTCAIQLLYLIEYADFDSQSTIGVGRTELSGGSWVKDSYIGVTGKSNSDGNATANTGGDTNNAYMSYRGIENFYGNIYQWIDGVNINNNIPYVCNNEAQYTDDTATNYTRLQTIGGVDVTLHNADGWANTIAQIQTGFLAESVGASSSTQLCDYYYQSTGWRVVRFGGYAASTLYAGAFRVSANVASSLDDVSIGGRLCY